ncbi:MAG: type II secretion system protein [Thermodesulfovibrionales bacterium]
MNTVITAVPTGFGFTARARKAFTSEGGFSLAEMAIGLVILAIIIGVVIMSGMQTVKDSKSTAASQQLEAVQGAVVSYLAKYGGYPADLAVANMSVYLPTAPDTGKYAWTCDATGGAYLVYTAADGTEATNVRTQWSKRLGANATLPTTTTVKGVIQAGPITCI